MGTTSSAPTAELSQEQTDIKKLGERHPFGDAELLHLYRAYQAHLRITPDTRTSFLTDIACQVVSPEDMDERHVLLQAVEQKILPANFGNILYQQAFLSSGDTSEYEGGPPTTTQDEYSRMTRLEAFFDGVSNCTRRGAKDALKVLIQCCEGQPAPASVTMTDPFGGNSSSKTIYIKPMDLTTIGYRVALAAAFLQATARNDEDVAQFLPKDEESSHDAALKSLADSLTESARRRRQREIRSSIPDTETLSVVEEADVQEWVENVATLFPSALASLTHAIFFPDKPLPRTRTNFEFPRLLEESSFFHVGSSPLLFSFACMSSALSGEFYRLYTSASDGLSFNRLQNALLGYGGPTLVIIQSGSSIFGAFTASPWKESKDFYGNTDCFLYQLLPKTAVYRPSGNGRNFMYCNSYARSRGYDQQAHGIGFGGSVDQPRLFLAESFDTCHAGSQDLTFEKGPLLATSHDTHFDIDNLEVWGVGGTEVVEEALGARMRQRGIRDAAIQKARKVDKAAFLDDFKSGIIESKAFQHRDQIRGNEGAAIDMDDPEHPKYGKL
jgi:hypothetical protein